MKKLLLSVIVFSFLFTGCSNEIEDNLEIKGNPETSSSLKDPKVINGMLVFENIQQMISILDKHETLSDEDFVQQEINTYKGFTSQRSIIIAIAKAENELSESYINAKDKLSKQAIKERRYSDLYKEKIQSGLIRQTEDENGYTSYRYSILRPYLASIANEDGFYAIGSTIFQITENSEKGWENGNFNNLSTLKLAKESDPENKISVNTFPKLRASGSTETTSTQGDHRIGIQMNYRTYYSSYNIIWNHYMAVGVSFEILDRNLNKWIQSVEAVCFHVIRQTYMSVQNPQTGVIKEVNTGQFYTQNCQGVYQVQFWKRFSLLSEDATLGNTNEWYSQYIENNVAYNILDMNLMMYDIEVNSGGHNHIAKLLYTRH